jgi:hypothetical protein
MSENIKGTDHSADLSVDGRIILEWNLRKQGEKFGVVAAGSG